VNIRENNLKKLNNGEFDVLIVGGGINGAVSAASLAARGCRVALIDKGDYASFTSQESSNLVWGGIKYLENVELFLVKKLCNSRNVLMDAFPSSVKEIRFFMPIAYGFKYPLLAMYVGTLLYWLMGNFFTKKPRRFSLKNLKGEESVINHSMFKGAIEYSDAFLLDNDARFVFKFISAAMASGAVAANYIEALRSEKSSQGGWNTSCKNVIDGTTFNVKSKVVINAAGPFVDQFNQINGITTQARHVLSKGIHLLVDRIVDKKRVLTFFDDQDRLFFVIPMHDKSVIGTTDTPVKSPFSSVEKEDRDYLLDNINKRLSLQKPLTYEDIISERCGVRPLVINDPGKSDDGQVKWLKLSRKHVIERNGDLTYASIFGGKLTDCLNIGEEVVALVSKMGIEMNSLDSRWFGEPSGEIRREFFRQARQEDLDAYRKNKDYEPLHLRLWRRYGTKAFSMLEEIKHDPKMGEVLIEGSQYLRCELYHAARREMVVKLEDFLRRRSKISLVISEKQLKQANGLREACEILFGNQAEEQYQAYFASRSK